MLPLLLVVTGSLMALAISEHVERAVPLLRRLGLGAVGMASLALGCGVTAWFVNRGSKELFVDSMVLGAEKTGQFEVPPDPPALSIEALIPVQKDVQNVRQPESLADRIKVKNLGPRPDWVEGRPSLQQAVHRVPVSSGPYLTMQRSHDGLLKVLKEKTDDYVNDLCGEVYASRHSRLDFDVDFIRSKLVRERPFEEVLTGGSQGDVYVTHALLEFDESFQHLIQKKWSEIVQTRQLLKTGFGATGLILLLGVMFSYFKLDTATRGFYTRRLQLLTVAAILTLVVAGVFAARWTPWN